MACVRLHHRCSVAVAYRFMIATAFVVLMPYTVQAADELPKEAVLPMNMADKAIQASLDACNKDGYRVSVSVVDRAGVLRAMAEPMGPGRIRSIAAGRRPIPRRVYAVQRPSWLS